MPPENSEPTSAAALPSTPGLSWRPLETADLDNLFVLIDYIQRHDDLQERTTREDLHSYAARPWVDVTRNGIVGVDDSGAIKAWGRTGFRPGAIENLTVLLIGGVHPDWRRRGIGRAILTWQHARAGENLTELRDADPAARDLPGRIGAYVETQVEGASALFEAGGYRAMRWFNDMRRDLADLPSDRASEVAAPPGTALRWFDDSLSESTRLAHNVAFAEHWGHQPLDHAAWRAELVDEPTFRPAMSPLLVDEKAPDVVLAYALNAEYEVDWAAQGFREGYTDRLGVRPQWRGKGLGRFLLERSAQAFRDRGHRFAALGVDTDNQTGAVALYQGLGYQATHRTIYYGMDN